jgi:hypothetical protein
MFNVCSSRENCLLAECGSAANNICSDTEVFRNKTVSLIHIFTCKGVRVTKITGSRSDDWIYWHFGYNRS